VIVTAGRFAEDGPGQKLLAAYHGQRVHLPGDPAARPGLVHVAWDRKIRFKGASGEASGSLQVWERSWQIPIWTRFLPPACLTNRGGSSLTVGFSPRSLSS
jgi:hypothetical protein